MGRARKSRPKGQQLPFPGLPCPQPAGEQSLAHPRSAASRYREAQCPPMPSRARAASPGPGFPKDSQPQDWQLPWSFLHVARFLFSACLPFATVRAECVYDASTAALRTVSLHRAKLSQGWSRQGCFSLRVEMHYPLGFLHLPYASEFSYQPTSELPLKSLAVVRSGPCS